MNYSELLAMSKTRKRKIANNTYLVALDYGGFGIRLHNTIIATFYPTHTVLNSGGYRTVTTKARLNKLVDGIVVWQDNFQWYIQTRSSFGHEGPEVYFEDGMILDNNSHTLLVKAKESNKKLKSAA